MTSCPQRGVPSSAFNSTSLGAMKPYSPMLRDSQMGKHGLPAAEHTERRGAVTEAEYPSTKYLPFGEKEAVCVPASFEIRWKPEPSRFPEKICSWRGSLWLLAKYTKPASASIPFTPITSNSLWVSCRSSVASEFSGFCLSKL